VNTMAGEAGRAGLSTQDWLAERVGDEASPVAVGHVRAAADGGSIAEGKGTDRAPAQPDRAASTEATAELAETPTGPPHNLDDPSSTAASAEPAAPDINAGSKRAAAWLGAGVTATAVLICAAFAVLGHDSAPPSPPEHHAPSPIAAPAPTTTAPPAPRQDQALPFTARTDSCTADGGTADQQALRSPQALTDTGTDSAWVCGRGPQESFVNGQVLHARFTCGPSRPESACSYMLNSVSVTPGWVAKTPGGTDEWLQHRVVTALQFNFFNGNQLAADPIRLETHSIHGPVSANLPNGILASRAEIIILHTARPPAEPLTTASGPTPPAEDGQPATGGLLDSLPGMPAQPVNTDENDPVDATFAMSQLQFYGHSPN
jgi:hypothetical protein